MIHARHNAGFALVFGAYVRRLLRRSFRSVWLREHQALPDGGFIAAANHASWWDGFIAFAAQTQFCSNAPFFVMMDERQLRRFPFFRWGGAFSVDGSNRRNALESVAYAAESAERGGGVWIFPEGRIAAPGTLLPFSAGYLHAARKACVPVVPVALRYAMLEAQQPDAFVDIGAPVDAAAPEAPGRIRAAVSRMLLDIDRAISAGTAFAGREPLFERRNGVDDIVSAFTAPIGMRL